jgi:hypothetical protein
LTVAGGDFALELLPLEGIEELLAELGFVLGGRTQRIFVIVKAFDEFVEDIRCGYGFPPVVACR